MLVLSRRPHEKILIPCINACIHVAAQEPGVVRVAIDAPPEVNILRGEVVDRTTEWGPPLPPPPAKATENASDVADVERLRRQDRLTRKRLRAASVRLGLARLQLSAGLTQDALIALGSIHKDLQKLRSRLGDKGRKGQIQAGRVREGGLVGEAAGRPLQPICTP